MIKHLNKSFNHFQVLTVSISLAVRIYLQIYFERFSGVLRSFISQVDLTFSKASPCFYVSTVQVF